MSGLRSAIRRENHRQMSAVRRIRLGLLSDSGFRFVSFFRCLENLPSGGLFGRLDRDFHPEGLQATKKTSGQFVFVPAFEVVATEVGVIGAVPLEVVDD